MKTVTFVSVEEISSGLSFGRIFKISKAGASLLLVELLGLRQLLVPGLTVTSQEVGDTIFRFDRSLQVGISVDQSDSVWKVGLSVGELDDWIEFVLRFCLDLPETDHLDVDVEVGDCDYQLTLQGDFRMPGGSPKDARRAIGLE